MRKDKERVKRKQNLGIYYTDSRIVHFIYDILLAWKEKEDKETSRWNSRGHYPAIIDPAVGEGIFLKVALERGFTAPKYVFGIDIDEEAKKKWLEINLIKEFGSQAELDGHFFHQNGLLPLNGEKVLRYKKGGLKEFDAVVGNPPYGGVGLGNESLSDELVSHLAGFGVLPESIKTQFVSANAQSALFSASDKSFGISEEARNRIKSFPIEILFLERFIQLAKPGGWVAVVIPDGILANSNSQYVREFIAKNTIVEAIVSLPRDAFKNVGTTAKTSILFLQKLKDREKRQDLNYPVFLASVESLDDKNFKAISDSYQEFYNKKS